MFSLVIKNNNNKKKLLTENGGRRLTRYWVLIISNLPSANIKTTILTPSPVLLVVNRLKPVAGKVKSLTILADMGIE